MLLELFALSSDTSPNLYGLFILKPSYNEYYLSIRDLCDQFSSFIACTGKSENVKLDKRHPAPL